MCLCHDSKQQPDRNAAVKAPGQVGSGPLLCLGWSSCCSSRDLPGTSQGTGPCPAPGAALSHDRSSASPDLGSSPSSLPSELLTPENPQFLPSAQGDGSSSRALGQTLQGDSMGDKDQGEKLCKVEFSLSPSATSSGLLSMCLCLLRCGKEEASEQEQLKAKSGTSPRLLSFHIPQNVPATAPQSHPDVP